MWDEFDQETSESELAAVPSCHGSVPNRYAAKARCSAITIAIRNNSLAHFSRAAPGHFSRALKHKGAGQRPYEEQHPDVWPKLEKLVDPVTRGDPESPLRWTCKSTSVLSAELFTQHGIRVSDKTVAQDAARARLQPAGAQQVRRGRAASRSQRAVRAHQRQGRDLHRARRPGHLRRYQEEGARRQLQERRAESGNPRARPSWSTSTTFPATRVGKAIPYGVYDIAANDGFVSVGVDHDTPVFAVTSIEAWWKQVGAQRYPDARELFITADAGGSNGHRARRLESRAPAARR